MQLVVLSTLGCVPILAAAMAVRVESNRSRARVSNAYPAEHGRLSNTWLAKVKKLANDKPNAKSRAEPLVNRQMTKPASAGCPLSVAYQNSADRARVRCASSRTGASTMRPSRLKTPPPAASKPASTRRAQSTSTGVGRNAALTPATWAG